ncbi:hypothetical protein ACWGIA_16950 [Streptomyces bobili]
MFVDPHHLVDVDPKSRNVGRILDQIQGAAERLLLSGGISHRVAIADCSDPAARDIADQFAGHGFRIRHAPHPESERAQILTVEVAEAASSTSEMRAVAVVASESNYLPLADYLHQSGRSLIAISGGVVKPNFAVDEPLTLPLSLNGLQDLIRSALLQLARENKYDVSLAELSNALQGLQTGFSIKAYGTQLNTQLRRMKGEGFVLHGPDRLLIDPPAVAAAATVAEPATRPNPSKPGHQDHEKTLMRAACKALPEPDDMTEASLVVAVRRILDTAANHPELCVTARGEGLRTTVIYAGLSVMAPKYRDGGLKPVDLCRQAVHDSPWTLERHPGNATDVRLRLTASPPEVPAAS